MRQPDGWFSTTLRVRYQETDGMGVVYHANYVTWFEIARTEWTRVNGFPYQDIERRGLYLPVVDISVQYKHPARYDDEVTVSCRPVEASEVRLKFEHEARLVNEPDKLLVTGHSAHVWVSKDWRPARLRKIAPDVYKALVNSVHKAGETE